MARRWSAAYGSLRNRARYVRVPVCRLACWRVGACVCVCVCMCACVRVASAQASASGRSVADEQRAKGRNRKMMWFCRVSDKKHHLAVRVFDCKTDAHTHTLTHSLTHTRTHVHLQTLPSHAHYSTWKRLRSTGVSALAGQLWCCCSRRASSTSTQTCSETVQDRYRIVCVCVQSECAPHILLGVCVCVCVRAVVVCECVCACAWWAGVLLRSRVRLCECARDWMGKHSRARA